MFVPGENIGYYSTGFLNYCDYGAKRLQIVMI
jgi:hypothetical protein